MNFFQSKFPLSKFHDCMMKHVIIARIIDRSNLYSMVYAIIYKMWSSMRKKGLIIMCTKYSSSHYFAYLPFCVYKLYNFYKLHWTSHCLICCTSNKSFIGSLTQSYKTILCAHKAFILFHAGWQTSNNKILNFIKTLAKTNILMILR